MPAWEVCEFNCINYPSGVILICLAFLSTIVLCFGNCTRMEQTRHLIRKRIAPSRLRSLEENDLPTVVFADCTELGQHVSFIIHLMVGSMVPWEQQQKAVCTSRPYSPSCFLVGFHLAPGCPEGDLWLTYMTSRRLRYACVCQGQ